MEQTPPIIPGLDRESGMDEFRTALTRNYRGGNKTNQRRSTLGVVAIAMYGALMAREGDE